MYTLTLTAAQVKVLWNTIDGALDAGACEDGLTKSESRSLSAIMNKMLPMVTDGKIKAINDIDDIEHAFKEGWEMGNLSDFPVISPEEMERDWKLYEGEL